MSDLCKPSLLLVDDNADVLLSLETLFTDDYAIESARSGPEAVAIVRNHGGIDACVMDIRMAGMDGIQALREIRRIDPDLPVVLHTGYAGEYDEEEIEHTDAPFDFIPKGESITRLIRSVHKAVEMRRLKKGRDELFECAERDYGIVTRSSAMLEPLRLVRKAAATQSPVMILGESGTGKELIARAIHRESTRGQFELGVFQCNLKSQQLVDSDLFGYEKGAFTGAKERHTGKLEYHDGSAILLDEIGDLDMDTQSKILRVVETGEFRPVGSSKDKRVDVRFLCATHRDLAAMVRDGEFRLDLYHRLEGFVITLPPLRERDGDIPLLAKHFLRLHTSRESSPPKLIDDGAMDILVRHHWPGNVRQLANQVRSLVDKTDSDIILADDVQRLLGFEPLAGTDCVGASTGLREREMAFRRSCIMDALRETNGNIAAAARLLKVDRANLRRWIVDLGIEP
ncbi:response regulator [candidate division GN15 bacterium]|nr:response regulator [candidate division GN15 bacterium]